MEFGCRRRKEDKRRVCFLFFDIYITMNAETMNRLKKLDIEEMLWIVLIGLILLSFYANQKEREYLIDGNDESKEKYRGLMLFIFVVALGTYFYYFCDSIQELWGLNSSSSEEEVWYAKLSFVSSLLIFVAGIILVYIAYFDDKLLSELALN